VSRYLGGLCSTLSRHEAAAHFEYALELDARMGARPWLAHSQYDCARMLLGCNTPAALQRASDMLGEAKAIYQELGMDAYALKAGACKVEPETR
jgi:hypothetical protein